MAVLIHGPKLKRYRYTPHDRRPHVDRVDDTTFDRLTPAERRGVLMAIAALRDPNAPVGIAIDLTDKHGDPVHVGDTLRFDEKEWGSPHTFTVEIRRGEIVVSGAPSDIGAWCEILTKFDGREVRK